LQYFREENYSVPSAGSPTYRSNSTSMVSSLRSVLHIQDNADEKDLVICVGMRDNVFPEIPRHHEIGIEMPQSLSQCRSAKKDMSVH